MEQTKYNQKVNSAQQGADFKPTPQSVPAETKIDIRADDKIANDTMLNEGGNRIQQKSATTPPNVNNDKQRQTVAALEQAPHEEPKNRNDDAGSSSNKPEQDPNPSKVGSDQPGKEAKSLDRDAPASGIASAGPDGKKVFTP